ncbi:EAL domain-containing protein [Rhizobium sp. SJZ105]|uniref:EAL domain-containing protein n=1 Tax=Rhizobium sp. SJZ105 TaxID=2572678 RepID=UPI002AA5A76C|nr:EAL domain-containing protein [Rhizobium sp. SJZ105]
MGAIVLEDACSMLAEFPDIDIALNASLVELCSPSYPLNIIAALEKWQIPANRLEIEITESAATGEDGRSERNIAALRAARVRFAIDDFGTGTRHSRGFRSSMLIASRLTDPLSRKSTEATTGLLSLR